MTSDEFRSIRKEIGLTQASLGGLMGMPQKAIARIESNERQPTKQHSATILLVKVLSEHDLLPPQVKQKK